jgi:hypothetical protein
MPMTDHGSRALRSAPELLDGRSGNVVIESVQGVISVEIVASRFFKFSSVLTLRLIIVAVISVV